MLPLGEIWLRKSPILGVRRSASAQVIVWAFVDATKGFWHEFPDVGHNRFLCRPDTCVIFVCVDGSK